MDTVLRDNMTILPGKLLKIPLLISCDSAVYIYIYLHIFTVLLADMVEIAVSSTNALWNGIGVSMFCLVIKTYDAIIWGV